MKRSPLTRKTPIRKRRPGPPRRGQPTAAEKSAIRLKVYERAGGQCELRLLPDCIRGVLPWDGPDPWSHGHLVHVRSRGAGGKWTLENCRWGCWRCHLVGMHEKGISAPELAVFEQNSTLNLQQMKKTVAKKTQSTPWRNRIVGHGEEAPDQLLANPGNWRIHPDAQQKALVGIMSEVGLVQSVIVNQRTGHLVDGHMRALLAMKAEQPTVPVVYVDLSLEEEAKILATIDPIAAMAATDQAQLASLLHDVETDDAAVQALLDQLAATINTETLDPTEGRDDSGGAERVPVMKFGSYKIPISVEESCNLGRLAEKYAEAHGAFYGFAAYLVSHVSA